MTLRFWIAQAMIDEGGSFVHALGQCVRKADNENYSKLVMAFPEYFVQYTRIALRMKALDDAKL